MNIPPPSPAHLHRAIVSLLHPADGDVSERSVRCQMLYHPTDASYTVWVRSGIREPLSAALTSALGRPFAVSDDYWLLTKGEAESLLSETTA